MSKFALKARWVLPIETPPIEGGVVTIEQGRIVAVGSQREGDAAVEDLGDVVLMPGLVNAHTHLEFSGLAQPLGEPGMSLPDWIRLVIASRKQTDPKPAVEAGIQESLEAGVTTLGEIATSTLTFENVAKLPELVAFQEVIGFSAGRVHSVFSELRERVERSSAAIATGVSPHAPYTVHPALLEKLVELSVERQLPVAMHLAESREELQLLKENRGPFRELLEERSMWDDDVYASGVQPLDLLQLLARAPRTLVVHGNYLSPPEIEFIAKQRGRMAVVYCPRTHAFFGHSPYPLREMLEAGVHVAIGTDSRASNSDLSLLSELRFVARQHDRLSAEQLLRLGTLAGAEALGMADSVGSLVAGKLAHLTVIPCESLQRSPYEEVIQSDQRPIQTWLSGKTVYR